MKKRLLSLTLALIMLTGLLPTTASADELPPETTPAAAEQPAAESTPAPVTPTPAPTPAPEQSSAEPVQPSAEPTASAQPQESPDVEPTAEPEDGESGVPTPSAKLEDDNKAEENEVEDEDESSPSAAPQIAVQSSGDTLTIYFNSNGGSGYMSPEYCVPFDQKYTLPACTFTREGYTFEYWQAGSGEKTKKFYSGQPFYCGSNESYLYEYDEWLEEYDVYLTAIWKADPVSAAFSAIETALGDKTVRKTGSLGLPASNDEYAVNYNSSDTGFLSIDGNVLTLPESGTVTVTLTAMVTPTGGETQTREYTLTLYSEEAIEAEKLLNAALNKLPGVFAPVYGTDTNANTYIKTKLGSEYADVAVSVNSAEGCVGCSVDASEGETNGNIEYFYDEEMKAGDAGRPRITFVLTYRGVSLEKELSSNIPWDRAKVEARLATELERLSLPAELTEGGKLSLPHYTVKEGITDPDYDNYNHVNSWGVITWKSGNTKVIGNIVGGSQIYAPYTADIKQQKDDVTVTLTATIEWGRDSCLLTKERTFEIVVKGSGIDEAQVERNELMIRLETGLSNPGLKDNTTFEALDYDNVINNIRFPLPKQYKLNTSKLNTGKYAVTITSSDACIIPPKGNATIGTVTRPLAGEEPVRVKLTVTITKKANPDIFASKDIWVTVQPIVNEEIDRELALMEYVKAHYFDGIRNQNTDPGNITTDLRPFTEAHYNDAGEVVWEYTSIDMTNDGIVPVAMDGWYESEQWRTFRSSNPAVITHENLLVTRAKEHKSVTITSWLSSERYETLAEKYKDTDTRLANLINQEVSIELTVTGTDPTAAKPDEKGLTVGFTLADNGNVWLSCQFTGLNEGVTVYDVFYRALSENGFSAAGGGFVTSVSGPNGTLSQKDRGEYSGWMYSVNGSIPNVVMAQYYLSDGDRILFFYTDDYTKISGMSKTVTVEDVIKLIDAIGAVTTASGDKIVAARAAYDALSLADKGRVMNRNTLFEAERAYAALIKRGEERADILRTTGDFVLSDEAEKLSEFGGEWLIIGLSRAGRDVPDGYIGAAEEYVRNHADSSGRLSAERATDNARLILALSALGEDVTDFGGHNLLAPLGNMDYIEKQGLSGVVYALLALDCRGYDIPAAPDGARQTTREALVNYLMDKQLADGGWAFSGDEAEPDMTAMVIQALAAYYTGKPASELEGAVKKAVDDGVARLSAMQTGTGGYVSYGTLNSESAAQVIVALTALGIDPAEDARFVKNGASVVDALCAFYIDGGGFRHSMDGGRDELATAQGYYALAAYYRFTEGKTALFDMSDVSASASAKAA